MEAWTSAYVTLDGLGVFPAQVATFTRHKGAVCPRFRFAVAVRVVLAIDERNAREGNQNAVHMEWDGDVILVTEPARAGVEGYRPERIEPDSDGMYRIGACFWPWTEVWCEGDVHADDPDDLASPVAILRRVQEPPTARDDATEVEVLDVAYCHTCLQRARVTHPDTEILPLPPL
jgi:hypothetical protein